MDWLRRAVPRPLKERVKTRLGMPLTRLHPDWRVLAPIGPVTGEHVVLDVGAHHGWFFHCWLDWCPGARVHAFEPFPESFARMRQLYGSDSRVALNPVGVAEAPGRLRLKSMSESAVSNSFLPHRPDAWDEVRFRTGTVSEVDVPVVTLDAYCARHVPGPIYLAKIDVQGFELKVLEGARATLPRVDHVFVESGIRPLYEGAARFTDVVEFMWDQGFHLMAMREWHRGNHVLVEADMLFRRDGLQPPVDETIDRVVEQ